jgi:hypothetical protein
LRGYLQRNKGLKHPGEVKPLLVFNYPDETADKKSGQALQKLKSEMNYLSAWLMLTAHSCLRLITL